MSRYFFFLPIGGDECGSKASGLNGEKANSAGRQNASKTGWGDEPVRLRHKLLIILFSMVLVPSLLLGYYFSRNAYRIVLQHTLTESKASVEQIRVNLRERLLTYIQVSNLILAHRELKLFLENPPEDRQKQIDSYQKLIRPEVERYSIVNPNLKVTIYTENQHILLDNFNIVYADHNIRNEPWYQAVKNTDNNLLWRGLFLKQRESSFHSYVFSFYRVIRLDNQEPVAVMEVQVDEAHLFSLISEESELKTFLIVNPHGEVITSNRREWLGLAASGLLGEDWDRRGEQYESVLNGVESAVFVKSVNASSHVLDWKVISIVPVGSLSAEAYRAEKWGFVLTLLLLIWSAAVVFFVTGRVSKRIRTLAQSMNGIRRGQFGAQIDVKGRDEISDLGHTFNLMSSRLKELVYEVYEAQIIRKDIELKQRQAELKALQSQINPHFLFNTLDSIRTGVLRNRDYASAEKIELLAALFRKTLEWTDDLIPLREELEFVSDYVRLQQFRFKDRIAVRMDIGQDLLDTLVPKFILQPLVENAIIHGIESCERHCTIRIGAEICNDELRILVEDDGAGMSEKQWMQLSDALRSETVPTNGQSIGLKNVNDRIKLMYGASFGLEVERLQPSGTRVAIRFPRSITKGRGGGHVQSADCG